MAVTTAMITNGGVSLLLEQELNAGPSPVISYVALGLGCGLLSAPLTSGSAYTALSLSTPLVAAIASGASLTIINGANSQVVTENGGGASIGATSITVSNFVANANYPIGSGVVTTPLITDTQLFNEALRNVTSASVVGGNPGELLASLYTAPGDGASTTYLEVGFYAGSATAAVNSGTLFARAVYWFPHVLNVDSAMAQLDLTV